MFRSLSFLLRALPALVVVLLALPGGAMAAPEVAMEPVGSSVVRFTDRWELKPEYSSPDNVFLLHRRAFATSFTYSETTEFGAVDAPTAMDAFSSTFTDVFDSGSARVLLSGVAGDTTGWRVYAATMHEVPVAVVLTAETGKQPGTTILTMVMAPAGSMDIALDDLAGIQVDEMPTAIARLDTGLIVDTIEADISGLSDSASAVVVDGVDYRQLDAPAGCDRIGWAITDPAQRPAAQAEIDGRGACAGGVTYVAQCGTVPGERADQRYIACEVTALVTSGTQSFAFDMFELFEADGSSEYIDFGMSFGNGELFASDPVPEGATVTGVAPFAIDVTATEPLLLEIRPPSLPAGTDPAVIVIEGPLQALAVFD